MTVKVVVHNCTTTLADLSTAIERYQKITAAGFDVKASATHYWVEFETDEEAVAFKLTYL